MADFRPIIAAKLASGPAWSQSFRLLKSTVTRMVTDGHIQRIAPVGSRSRNMIELTDAGRSKWLRARQPQQPKD